MTKHYRSAFGRPIGMSALERKDANDVDVSDVKAAIKKVGEAFHEFKATNDTRLKELEKKDSADPLFEEKMKRIDKVLDISENITKTIQAQTETKKALDELSESFDRIQTMLRRAGAPYVQAETKTRTNDWARAVFGATTMGVANLTAERKAILDGIANEYKALNVANDSAGGYFAPVEFVREVLKQVTEITPARALVNIRQTGSKSINLPRRTGRFAAQRIQEMGTKTETTGYQTGLDEMTAPEMFALVDITNDMLEDSFIDIAAEIQNEATEQFAFQEGYEWINGTGIGQYEGLLNNSSIGVTGTGSAAITADSLITVRGAIKSFYTNAGRYIMNRKTIAAVRRLKDNNNQYLWMPLSGANPNSIAGDPYTEVPDLPDVASSAYPIIYGDFKRGYTILDRVSMEMLRDPYTQATGGAVRFIFRKRTGGKVMMAEAMQKIQCA
jgi:HK97 family phage major capsid protein